MPSTSAAEEASPLRLARRVARFSREHDLLAGEPIVLIMVSGGQDSVALLHLLADSPWSAPVGGLRVLHVNHRLRGEDSELDAALVRAHAEGLDLPLRVVDLPLEPGGNVQERARDLRLRAAQQEAASVRRESGREVRIATGHTLDDQAETMLYRLARYGGIAALDALRPRRGLWIRPLLEVRRRETAAYCHDRGLTYREDRSNTSPGYVRTGLRAEVVPALEAALPGALATMGRAAEVAAETRDALDVVLDALDRDLGVGEGAGRRWAAGGLTAYPAPLVRAFLHRVLSRDPARPPSRRAVLLVHRAVLGGRPAEVDLGGGLRAEVGYGLLTLRQAGGTRDDRRAAARSEPADQRHLPVPGDVRWGDVVLSARLTDRFSAPVPGREAFLDADAVLAAPTGVVPVEQDAGTETPPLLVRGVCPGDRMRPLGAPGTRKVQDILVDAGVPRARRAFVPVLVRGSSILWLGGYVVAHEGRITRETERLVHVRIEEGDGV